jgi:hypothetical protein
VAEGREHLDVGPPGSPGRGDDRLETPREIARPEGDDARDPALNTRIAQDGGILRAWRRFVNAPTERDESLYDKGIAATYRVKTLQKEKDPMVRWLLSGESVLLAQQPPPATPPAPATPGTVEVSPVAIPPARLDSLVTPIALYPDPLLAQTLVASTCPLEIIQLQQWLEKNKGLKDKALADAVAQAIADGHTDRRDPYRGYFFKVLKGQGPAAPDGEMDFVIKGVMIGGFALVAAPADYEATGVKTFIVSHDGVVFEKDLGPGTLEQFSVMGRSDPDPTWKPVTAP